MLQAKRNDTPGPKPCRLPGFLNLRTLFLAAGGGWIAYSRFVIDHNMPLPPALDAARATLFCEVTGMLSYYVDEQAKGKGRPLVLLHSINAAGCAYEMRPLFEHYRKTRPVYALELPGFGFSERSDRIYSPTLYQQAILDFMIEAVDEPADVVALSLGCEFAALAAQAHPKAFRSLTMISPSGFTPRRRQGSSQQAGSSGLSDLVYQLLTFPLWSQAFYDLLATRPSIKFFLARSFEGPVDSGLADYGYLTAHQPGARYAPLYFVSGKLFTPDVRETVYENLALPVLVLFDRDGYVKFDELAGVVERHANWRAVRIHPTWGLPHFERLEETVAALDKFWAAKR
ncbi:MAG: alpha/beta fold hydrolase [Anaerolineae bacterium]|nr:alpha/beta fold hydrolase [Anaerolineae bacterium]